MRCPRCGLINDDGVRNCDCGHDFRTGGVARGFVVRRRRWRTLSWFHWLVLVGIVLIVEVGATLAWGKAALPAGLVAVAIVGYLASWENVRS